MCLFGSEIGWMKNFWKKIKMKTFWIAFGWVERKENKWWDPGVFSSGLPKNFLPKMERKLKWKIGHLGTVDELVHIDLLHFFFSFFLFLSFGCCLSFFFFSFDLQGRLCKRLVLIFFSFFFLLLSFIFFLFFCLDVIFFFQTWFLFFNKFRWLIFFGCLSLFWF